MGQAASRQAAKQVQKAAKTAAGNGNAKTAAKAAINATPEPAARPPPLGRAYAEAPEVTEDATEALKKRQQKEAKELLQPPPPQAAAATQPGPVSTPGGRQQPPRPGQPPQQAPPQHLQQKPQADPNSGFFRGQIVDPRDVAQEQFLIHHQGGKGQPSQEMAPDLLKFLQDAGPLEKKVDKVS